MKRNTIFSETENIPKPSKDRIDSVIFLGQRYMDTHTPRKTSVFYLFVEQIKYLSPTLWLFQLAAIILISSFAISQADSADNIYSILFQVSPLVSMMAIPELIKDVLCNMTEIERSCKNNGSTILLLRLIAVGMINVSVIALISGILAGTYQLNFFVLLLYAIVPYNCANIMSLLVIRVLKISSRSCAFALSLISAFIMFALPVQTLLISALSITTLMISLLVTILILIIQIIRIFNSYPKGELIYGIEN